MNNIVYYHYYGGITAQNNSQSNPQIVYEHEYLGTVKEVLINHTYACALTDGKAVLHSIDNSNPSNKDQMKTFPSRNEGSLVDLITSCLVHCLNTPPSTHVRIVLSNHLHRVDG
jgi:hypothetical protein